jgi:hypothetical protein
LEFNKHCAVEAALADLSGSHQRQQQKQQQQQQFL